ncbi:DUF5320 domain-containing protein [Carboxylicivirga sp. N1Y90]|uniref:DUF5320 domain-containing protein n=1 Tax=Carboxylicivirga fragile TaxID=3417571 RepID=UPI003D35260F|nr:DUF5320 domain-containing protein [Marinilabiliaceae bacterium N1Y90]
MPRFDGTGPSGQGPDTGRSKGKCRSNDKKNADQPGMERGMGRGRRGVGNNAGSRFRFRSGDL